MDMRVGLMAGLLLGAFFVGLVPAASAQGQACSQVGLTCQTTTELIITPPTQPAKPLGPFITLPITVRYTYVTTAAVSLSATPIQLSVANAPSWAVITLSPTTVYIPVSQTNAAGGQQQQITAETQANLLVSATQDAPAFVQGPIEILASAAANGALLPSETRNAISIQADFFSIIEASTPTTIQKAKPQQQVEYPVTVTNFGNALTKVEFVIESVPDKWQVSPPAPITLNARQTGQAQNTRTANVNIQTPFQNGYLNVVGAITVRMKSNYALDPKVLGDSTILSTLTTTKGFYVPGAELPLMVLGMAGAAMVLGRVRRPDEPG